MGLFYLWTWSLFSLAYASGFPSPELSSARISSTVALHVSKQSPLKTQTRLGLFYLTGVLIGGTLYERDEPKGLDYLLDAYHRGYTKAGLLLGQYFLLTDPVRGMKILEEICCSPLDLNSLSQVKILFAKLGKIYASGGPFSFFHPSAYLPQDLVLAEKCLLAAYNLGDIQSGIYWAQVLRKIDPCRSYEMFQSIYQASDDGKCRELIRASLAEAQLFCGETYLLGGEMTKWGKGNECAKYLVKPRRDLAWFYLRGSFENGELKAGVLLWNSLKQENRDEASIFFEKVVKKGLELGLTEDEIRRKAVDWLAAEKDTHEIITENNSQRDEGSSA